MLINHLGKLTILLLLFLGCCFSIAIDATCPDGSIGMMKHMANISSTKSCEIKQLTVQHKLLHDNLAGNSTICYSKNGLLDPVCTKACSALVPGFLEPGIAEVEIWDICTNWNATEWGYNGTCGNWFMTYWTACYSDWADYCTYAPSILGFSCVTYANAKCICKQERLLKIVKVDCGNGWFEPMATYDQIICKDDYTIINLQPIDSELSITQIKRIYIRDHFITMEIMPLSNKHWLVIELDYFEELSKLRNRTKELIWFNVSKSTQEILIGDTQFIHRIFADGESRKLLWVNEHNNNLVNSEPENVTESDYCNRGLCTHCADSLSTSYCKVSNFGWWKTAFIIFFVILLLSCIPWFLAFFTIIYRLFKFCFCTPNAILEKFKPKPKQDIEMPTLSQANEKLNTKRNEIDQKNKQKDLDELDSDDEYKRMLEEEEEKERKQKKRAWPKAKGSKNRIFNYLAIIGICISMAHASCTDSLLSTSNFRTCTYHNDTHKSCLYRPTFEIALQEPGDKTCIIATFNDSSVPFSINVTYKNLFAESNLVLQYLTADWTPEFKSSKSCFLTDCCTYHQTKSCSQWEETGEQNPCNKFPDSYFINPGFTGCLSNPGCIANGCFSCHESCNYYRANFNIGNSIWNVSNVGLTIVKGTFLVEISNLDEIEFTTESPNYDDGTYKIEIIGILHDFDFNFDRYVVNSGNTAYYAHASRANEPRAGLIGDLQANSASDFHNSPSTVIFDRRIVEITVHSSGTEATYANSGIKQMETDHQFPTNIDGFIWQFDYKNNKIKSSINRRSTGILKFEAKENLQFYERIEETCPKIGDNGKVTGCYACAGGANYENTIKSDCYSGTCYLYTDDPSIILTGNSIEISTNEKPFKIGFLSATNIIAFKLNVACNGGKTEVDVRGKLNSDTDIYNGYNQTQVDNHADSGKFNNSVLDWLKNLLKIPKFWVLFIFYSLIFLASMMFLMSIAYLIYKINHHPKINLGLSTNKGKFIQQITGMHHLKKELHKARKYKEIKQEEDE